MKSIFIKNQIFLRLIVAGALVSGLIPVSNACTATQVETFAAVVARIQAEGLANPSVSLDESYQGSAFGEVSENAVKAETFAEVVAKIQAEAKASGENASEH